MGFTVEVNGKEIFPVIILKNEEEKTSAEVYAFGALLNAFTIQGSKNIIDGFSSPQDARENITSGFKSAKLNPFVCRVLNGEYYLNDEKFKIEKFYLGAEAIHGLLFDAVFSIVKYTANVHEALVELRYDYKNNDAGFPFNYSCIVEYKLEKNNSLTLATSVKNNSGTEMPVCDGWHPYFNLHTSIDNLMVEINSNKILEFNERLVPTGKVLTYEKFQGSEVFADTVLDNCFLLNENSKPACVLKNVQSGLQLTIQSDKSYPYLQLYTPEHRNSIAIENLSAPPDAFNNKTGLTILKPNQSASFKTTYKASISIN